MNCAGRSCLLDSGLRHLANATLIAMQDYWLLEPWLCSTRWTSLLTLLLSEMKSWLPAWRWLHNFFLSLLYKFWLRVYLHVSIVFAKMIMQRIPQDIGRGEYWPGDNVQEGNCLGGNCLGDMFLGGYWPRGILPRGILARILGRIPIFIATVIQTICQLFNSIYTLTVLNMQFNFII